MLPPGAASSTSGPTEEKFDSESSPSVELTAIVVENFAGYPTSPPYSFPAAATGNTPLLNAYRQASATTYEYSVPPRLMLAISYPWSVVHSIPAATSE
jgi:hypothetical protein